MPVTPKALAHVVYRTRRFADMLDWYRTVFDARVQHQNPATDHECNDHIRGPAFAANPVGVEFDPEEWLAAVRDGASLEDFRTRTVHEPVSPIRGEISALL